MHTKIRKPSKKEVIEGIWQAEETGDHLLAFDRASKAIERFTKDEKLKYYAVRALARSGSPWQAQALYREYDLAKSADTDIASLEARIAKDQFLLNRSDLKAAARSAKLYERVFDRTQDHYPGINAATMWALAGRPRKPKDIARKVLDICEAETATSGMHQYWLSATQAEAALLLGDIEAATEYLWIAARIARRRYDALAATANQLRLICRTQGMDGSFLDELPLPTVIFYAGHMIVPPGRPGRFAAREEKAVARRILESLNAQDVRIGYGSLASGADILFAEALLKRKAELHVTLPFDIEEFKEVSVAPAGKNWLRRFEACLEDATSVIHATQGAYLGHDALFGYAARVGMGLARIRGRALAVSPEMITVWDGEPPSGNAGTAVDVSYWQSRGFETKIISPGPPPKTTRIAPKGGRAPEKTPDRSILPVLFGDIKGFSGFQEEHLPIFSNTVMSLLGEKIHGFGKDVVFTNTWGDAIHVVFSNIVTAAECALDLQEVLGGIDYETLGLPHDVGMRLSLHIGPVFVGYDPVNREKTYFGRTLTRAARMEPITPVGEVYVTEEFAALIEMERGEHLHCNYVGDVPLAKKFGNLRMYRLVRVSA